MKRGDMVKYIGKGNRWIQPGEKAVIVSCVTRRETWISTLPMGGLFSAVVPTDSIEPIYQTRSTKF